MKTVYIERSTGECRSGDWVDQLQLDGVERIVVGTGPGSFAGIRSAISFAQGFRLGCPDVGVFGLPSACALADGSQLAVVGDARQGKRWIALFDGFALVKPVFQVEVANLGASIPEGLSVVSPDDRRIGEGLKALFGSRYLGERLPSAEGLERFVSHCPDILRPEPLPIYLNPAVRN